MADENGKTVEAWVEELEALAEEEKWEELKKCANTAGEQYPKSSIGFYYRAIAFTGLDQLYEAEKEYCKAEEREPEKVHIYLNRSWIRGHLGDFEGAISDCDKALATDPTLVNEASLFLSRAKAKSNLNQLDDAVRDYKIVATLDPSAKNLLLYATCNFELGRLIMAENYCARAIEADSGSVQSYELLGAIYSETCRYKEASLAFEKALQFDPNNSKILTNSARINRILKEFPEASEKLSRVLRLDDKNDEALHELARLYYDQRKYSDAIFYFTEALKIEQKDTHYSSRAFAYKQIGQHTEAIADYDDAIKLNEKVDWYYTERSISKTALQDYTGSLIDCDSALEINRKSYLALNSMGVNNIHLGQLDKAIKHFSLAIEINDEEPGLFCNRASCYDSLNYDDLALQDIKDALTLDPDNYQAYLTRGNFYSQRNNLELAINDFSQCIKIEKDDPKAYINRGNAFFRLKQYSDSISDFEYAINIGSTYTDALIPLAFAYKQIGNNETADAIFKRYTLLMEKEEPGSTLSELETKISKLPSDLSTARKHWENTKLDIYNTFNSYFTLQRSAQKHTIYYILIEIYNSNIQEVKNFMSLKKFNFKVYETIIRETLETTPLKEYNRLFSAPLASGINVGDNHHSKIAQIHAARNNIIHSNGTNSDTNSLWSNITSVTRERCQTLCWYQIEIMEVYLDFFKNHIQKNNKMAFNPYDPDLSSFFNMNKENQDPAQKTRIFLKGLIGSD